MIILLHGVPGVGKTATRESSGILPQTVARFIKEQSNVKALGKANGILAKEWSLKIGLSLRRDFWGRVPMYIMHFSV